jgi:hypothetical protein
MFVSGIRNLNARVESRASSKASPSKAPDDGQYGGNVLRNVLDVLKERGEGAISDSVISDLSSVIEFGIGIASFVDLRT